MKAEDFRYEIESVIAFGKKINFDFQNGDYNDLMRNWINHTREIYVEFQENKSDVARIVKSMINLTNNHS